MLCPKRGLVVTGSPTVAGDDNNENQMLETEH